MNNNDLLTRLHTDSENILPSDALDPETIEASLVGVKRKSNNKAFISCCCIILVLFVSLIGPLTDQHQYLMPIIDTTQVNPADYSNIYKAISKLKKNSYVDGFSYTSGSADCSIYAEPQEENKTTYNYTPFSGVTNSDFINTNVQVQGIDEADVVKTDGTYIYSIRNKKIFISKANNGKPNLISTIKSDYSLSEMYVYNGNLVIIANDNMKIIPTATPDEAYSYSYAYYDYYNYCNVTKVLVYDVSDASNPKLKSELMQAGNYISSRLINNIVYLTTNYSIYNYDQIKKNDPTTFCPVFSENGTMKCIEPDCVSITKKVNSIKYTTVASIDLNKSEKFADMCSVLGGGSEVYASHNNIYITAGLYDNGCYYKGDYKTQIMRFSIDGTEIEKNGDAIVKGYNLNQFSMDEHNGYFRIVTENLNNKNFDTITILSVFDKNLKLVGKLKKNVGDENIESVRFDGDTAYYVTFKNTDPLFTVDLSDPTSPQFMSELKITGFSDYLHPFDDGLLLGIGREANPKNGRNKGIKLSMFDVSDKENVTEISKNEFTSKNASSEALNNHKAVFIDLDNDIIGIPYGDNGKFNYSMFRYDKKKKEFVCISDIEYDNISYSLEYTRGIKIGEYFYIVTKNDIIAYQYSTLEEIGKLELLN